MLKKKAYWEWDTPVLRGGRAEDTTIKYIFFLCSFHQQWSLGRTTISWCARNTLLCLQTFPSSKSSCWQSPNANLQTSGRISAGWHRFENEGKQPDLVPESLLRQHFKLLSCKPKHFLHLWLSILSLPTPFLWINWKSFKVLWSCCVRVHVCMSVKMNSDCPYRWVPRRRQMSEYFLKKFLILSLLFWTALPSGNLYLEIRKDWREKTTVDERLPPLLGHLLWAAIWHAYWYPFSWWGSPFLLSKFQRSRTAWAFPGDQTSPSLMSNSWSGTSTWLTNLRCG